tara:strand:- start:582 stop:2057 length:1476 start_codon:yes stop_codon:yes gene_type:complete
MCTATKARFTDMSLNKENNEYDGIVYLICESKCRGISPARLKVGESKDKNELKRLKSYGINAIWSMIVEVKNRKKLEKKIKDCFKQKFRLVSGTTETFEGNQFEMQREFSNLFIMHNEEEYFNENEHSNGYDSFEFSFCDNSTTVTHNDKKYLCDNEVFEKFPKYYEDTIFLGTKKLFKVNLTPTITSTQTSFKIDIYLMRISESPWCKPIDELIKDDISRIDELEKSEELYNTSYCDSIKQIKTFIEEKKTFQREEYVGYISVSKLLEEHEINSSMKEEYEWIAKLINRRLLKNGEVYDILNNVYLDKIKACKKRITVDYMCEPQIEANTIFKEHERVIMNYLFTNTIVNDKFHMDVDLNKKNQYPFCICRYTFENQNPFDVESIWIHKYNKSTFDHVYLHKYRPYVAVVDTKNKNIHLLNRNRMYIGKNKLSNSLSECLLHEDVISKNIYDDTGVKSISVYMSEYRNMFKKNEYTITNIFAGMKVLIGN